MGFNKNSVFGDPRFEDRENDDFTLAADSPAWNLGFKPIDVARIRLRPKP